MKEKIKNELEQFNKVYNNLNNNLSISILTDIIGYMTDIKEQDGKEVLDFTNLDDSIKNIKELLNSVPVENIKAIKNIDTLKTTIKDDLAQDENMRQECMYSIRTLDWVINDVLKED